MRSSFVCAATTCILAACGCSSLSVSYDYDTAADFSQYKTYAWLESKGKGPSDPRIDNDLLDGRVRRSVDAELALKGLTKAPETEADLLVGYHVTLEEKIEVSTVDSTYGYGRGPGWRYGYGGWYGAPETRAYHYDEGTLLLDLVDRKTERLVWRGSATDRVELELHPEEREEGLRAAVKAMLAGFPPPKQDRS